MDPKIVAVAEAISYARTNERDSLLFVARAVRQAFFDESTGTTPDKIEFMNLCGFEGWGK